MDIKYTSNKHFTKEQIEELFLSVNWVSGQYPEKVYKALMNSETVITAWSGERLVGLARAIDDGEMVAFIHYVLVNPEYQGFGIAPKMINKIKEKYKNYFYIEIMPEDYKNQGFYEKLGFKKMPNGVPMNIENLSVV